MFNNKKVTVLFFNFWSFLTSRIYILLFLIIERLPLKIAIKCGRIFGTILFYLTINRRKIVEENICILKSWASKRNLINPILSKDSKLIAKEIYQYNVGNLFYAFSLLNKPVNIIKKNIEIKGFDLLNNASDEKKGAIILFSHTGPWELMAVIPKLIPSTAESNPMAAMYRPLNNPYMNKWYLKKRERYGIQFLSREDGFFRIVRNIKKGALIYLAFDIRMYEGSKVELFDKLASTSKIPYTLHKINKSPVYTISMIRSGDFTWEIQLKEVLSASKSSYAESDLLRASNDHLEQLIFNNPRDYFFFQNRFK